MRSRSIQRKLAAHLSGDMIHPGKSSLYQFASAYATLAKVTQDVLTDLEDLILTPSATAVLQARNKRNPPQSGRCKFADHILIMSR